MCHAATRSTHTQNNSAFPPLASLSLLGRLLGFIARPVDGRHPGRPCLFPQRHGCSGELRARALSQVWPVLFQLAKDVRPAAWLVRLRGAGRADLCALIGKLVAVRGRFQLCLSTMLVVITIRTFALPPSPPHPPIARPHGVLTCSNTTTVATSTRSASQSRATP